MVGKKGKTASPTEKPLSLDNPWKIYFADPDRQASSSDLTKRKQEREIFVPPHTELGCVMASHPLASSPVSQPPPSLPQSLAQMRDNGDRAYEWRKKKEKKK